MINNEYDARREEVHHGQELEKIRARVSELEEKVFLLEMQMGKAPIFSDESASYISGLSCGEVKFGNIDKS